MSTSPAIPVSTALASETPSHFFADLYAFNWGELNFRLPLICAFAVALCLFVGVAVGHPGGALLAAGGALTTGFGVNQRIGDSRLQPMIFAVLGMSTATLAGCMAGHRGSAILIFSAVAAAIYGVLTVRDSAVAWVGQQAAVSLFVASAFPSGVRLSLTRAGLIALGGLVQIAVTSLGLRLVPELRKDLLSIPVDLYHSVYEQRRELLHRLRELPASLPAPDRLAAITYALRLVATVVLSSELYRRMGIQSGYWVPMTALLVQKPAFYETLNRAALRIAGTLLGASLATHVAAHVHFGDWGLAALTTFFAFWCFATYSVNYGLFTLCITSYIVFLLSLNQIPGPELAHRRALCTIAGAAIALFIHIDALIRHRASPAAT